MLKHKTCSACDGRGKVPSVAGVGDSYCGDCGGTGRIAVDPSPPVEDILDEARRITDADRNSTCGDPEDNFARIAKAWDAIDLSPPITSAKVALAMIMLKVIREAHASRRDNWVDVVGYARCGWKAAGKP